MQLSLRVNDTEITLDDIDGSTPLLWVLRDELNLVGTKYGCGIGQCGACSVLIDGFPVRSCLLPIERIEAKRVTTIEGLAADENQLHPLQDAWIDLDVAQCGYCQAGQLINAYALLQRNLSPTDADIDQAMEGCLCRCGTYQRIRKAIHTAAEQLQQQEDRS